MSECKQLSILLVIFFFHQHLSSSLSILCTSYYTLELLINYVLI